jgi:hypothetical protein
LRRLNQHPRAPELRHRSRPPKACPTRTRPHHICTTALPVRHKEQISEPFDLSGDAFLCGWLRETVTHAYDNSDTPIAIPYAALNTGTDILDAAVDSCGVWIGIEVYENRTFFARQVHKPCVIDFASPYPFNLPDQRDIMSFGLLSLRSFSFISVLAIESRQMRARWAVPLHSAT